MNYVSGVRPIIEEDIKAARWILFYGQELMTEISDDTRRNHLIFHSWRGMLEYAA